MLERDYCIAWLLIGMAHTNLPSLLGFKGGTALKRCHFGDYRFSEDLDFTLLSGSTLEAALLELEAAYAEAHRLSGINLKHSRTEATAGLNSHVLRAYDEFSDLPEDRYISVYGLREIATEKIVALFDPARSEPRDLYDLWYLITQAGLDLGELLPAVETKLAFRGRKLLDVAGNFKKKEPRYKTLWANRLASQMVELPHFDETYREVQRAMRQGEITTSD